MAPELSILAAYQRVVPGIVDRYHYFRQIIISHVVGFGQFDFLFAEGMK